MRRALALSAATAGIFATAACGGGPAQPVSPVPTPTMSTTVSGPPRPTPALTPGDVAATKQVCADATAAAADVAKVFNDEIAAIEAAAAKGDQTAMVDAAGVIQDKFVALSKSLARLAQRPVDSDVKAALTRAAAALKEISSASYPGTPQDTQKRLADLAIIFAQACS